MLLFKSGLQLIMWYASKIFRSKKPKVPSMKEPAGLSRSDGKRPDGMTLIPWKAGKCALWDVTVIDTVAQLYVSQSSQCAGSTAELAATRKSVKYGEFSTSHFFCSHCAGVTRSVLFTSTVLSLRTRPENVCSVR